MADDVVSIPFRALLFAASCALCLAAWGRRDATEFTVSLGYAPESPWEKPCHVNSSPSGFDLYISPSTISYVVGGSERRIHGRVVHPQGVTDGKRHHYAAVIGQDAVDVYFDGRKLSRTEVAGFGTFDVDSIRVADGVPGRVDGFTVVPSAVRPQERPVVPLVPGVYAFSAMDWVHPGNFATKLTNATVEVSVSTAANERENVQLIVVPDSRDSKTLDVRAESSLCTRDGIRTNFGLKFSRIRYTPVPKPSHFMYAGMKIPDRLEAAQAVAREGDGPFAVWLEVETPCGTPPGVYRGWIEISVEGGLRGRIRLEVRVFGFELPRENAVPTLVNLWDRDILSYADGDPKRFLALLESYCGMLVEHRMNPIYLHEADLIVDADARRCYPDYSDGAENWGAFDELTGRLVERGMSRVVVGPFYRSPDAWRKTRNKEKTWRAVLEHVKEKGWLEKSVAYCIDEWGERDLEEASRVGEAMKEWAPGIKWLITGANKNYPAPDRLPAVDIWLPALHWVNPLQKAAEQARGREVWYYVCTGPQFPVPNLHGDTPLAAIRMVPGFGMRFGFDGFLHWGANFNTGRRAKPTAAYEYGEGQYVLAGENGEPVATCRLKALADGMEDWMAFHMLSGIDAGRAKALMKELEAIVPARTFDAAIPIDIKSPSEGSYGTFLDPYAFYRTYTDPACYLAWRERLYAAIEALDKKKRRTIP